MVRVVGSDDLDLIQAQASVGEEGLRIRDDSTARRRPVLLGPPSADEAERIERARRVLPIAVVQNNYSLAERKHDAVVDYCADAGIVRLVSAAEASSALARPWFPIHQLPL